MAILCRDLCVNLGTFRGIGIISLQGLFSNPIYYVIWISTMVAQVFIVQFGGRWFSTAALNLEQWLWCLAFGVGVLLWGQVTSFLCFVFIGTLICEI